MELKDLVGKRLLSGVEEVAVEITSYGRKETVNGVRFILDGKTYQATEDEDDGYRSYLREIEEVDLPVKNTFAPHEVLVTEAEDSDDDSIIITDCITAKEVMKIGTENSSDYYPWCVLHWNPENLAANSHIIPGQPNA